MEWSHRGRFSAGSQQGLDPGPAFLVEVERRFFQQGLDELSCRCLGIVRNQGTCEIDRRAQLPRQGALPLGDLDGLPVAGLRL